METSSLERIASSLETSLDSWGHWLAAATLLVVIGLVLEYWYQVKKLAKERPFRWRAFQELMGAVLVTVGVAGELLVQMRSSRIETALRDVNHNIEASLNKQAGDARREAAEANERTARILATIADRDLSQGQQLQVASVLRQFSGRMVRLRSYPGDGEAKRLGLEIQAALELAGIHTEDRLEQWLHDSPLVFGIEVECAAAEGKPGEQRDFANAIVGALSGSGNLSVRPLSQFGCSQAITGVNIGIKPAILAK
jgi:hypothetical protein